MPDPTVGAPSADGADFTDAPWVYACLQVAGEFDPDALDALLGVEAKKHRKGDPQRFRKGPAFWKRGTWHYSTVRVHDWDWSVQLQLILDMVQPQKAKFIEVTRDLEVFVHLVAAATVSTPFGTISPEALAGLAEIGCSLDMDLYSDWEQHDHAALAEGEVAPT